MATQDISPWSWANMIEVARKTLTPSCISLYLPDATPYTSPVLTPGVPERTFVPTIPRNVCDFILDNPFAYYPTTWPSLEDITAAGLCATNAVEFTGSMSTSFWVKRTSATYTRVMMAIGEASEINMAALSTVGSTRLDCTYRIAGASQLRNFDFTGTSLDGDSILPVGEWHHLSFVVDTTNDDMWLYYDGVKMNVQFDGLTSLVDAEVPQVNTVIGFGNRFEDNEFGKIEFFDYALTDADAANVYSDQAPTTSSVESWECDDGSGLICAASVGAVDLAASTLPNSTSPLTYNVYGGAITWDVDVDHGFSPDSVTRFYSPGITGRSFKMDVSFSMTTSLNNPVIRFTAYTNGVAVDGMGVDRKIGTGADVGAASFTGTVSLDHLDSIEIWMEADLATSVTLTHFAAVLLEVN